MNASVIPIQIKAVVPANAGRAVFLGNDEKVFVIYVDRSVGDAIQMFMDGTPKERPLTHDLMASFLAAFGAHVERIVINDIQGSTYYARIILIAENELMQKKIIEIDARPSDSMALAVQQRAPIYVTRAVWDEVEDMSEIVRSLENRALPEEEEPESEDTD